MPRLTGPELAAVLAANPEWRLEGDTLVRDLVFKDFVQAMAFVNRVAGIAEQQGHHPDIAIRYNGVRLALISHDDGGITDRDAAMLPLLGIEA